MRLHWLFIPVLILASLTACNVADDAAQLIPAAGDSCDEEGDRRGNLVCRDGTWITFVEDGDTGAPSLTDTDTATDTAAPHDVDVVEPGPDATTPPADAGEADTGGEDTEIACTDGSACPSGICDADTGTCAAPECDDRVKNGDETDVDCGGSCSPCMPGKSCLVKLDCGIDTEGNWGACEAAGAPCDDMGVKTRTVTARTCEDNVCVKTDTEESASCSHDSDGDTCAPRLEGPWSECTFEGFCDETGSSTREVTSYTCLSGSCEARTLTQTGPCPTPRPSTDGQPCRGSCGPEGLGFGECSQGTCQRRSGAQCMCDFECPSSGNCSIDGLCCPPGELCAI